MSDKTLSHGPNFHMNLHMTLAVGGELNITTISSTDRAVYIM